MGKRKNFSIVRVLGMLLLLAGFPFLCFFFPVGIGMMILGAVMVLGGD